jgi:hypothetical protein
MIRLSNSSISGKLRSSVLKATRAFPSSDSTSTVIGTLEIRAAQRASTTRSLMPPLKLRTIGLSAHDLKALARVRTEDRDEPIVIRGRLPSSEAVRRFIEEADPDLAKKVGAHASSMLVKALGSPQESR